MQIIYSADFSVPADRPLECRWEEVHRLTAQKRMESALRYLPPMGKRKYLKRFRRLVEACNRFAISTRAVIEVAIDKERRLARIDLRMEGFVIDSPFAKRFRDMKYAYDYFVFPFEDGGKNGRKGVSLLVGFFFYDPDR